MTQTNCEILKWDRRSKLADGFQSIPPSEMNRIRGGRCWDGPLGDRDECPPKQSSTSPTLTGDGSFTLEISCGSTF